MAAKTADIDLIVGLGNPGKQYQDTLHNAGFMFVDEIARQYGAQFRSDSKFKGDVCKITVSGRDVWLLKPTTFMNRSGQATSALARFYKIPTEHILVAHDELDLPFGTVRLKNAGGHGGHNGLRDIFDHLSSKDFLRLRIGIDHPGHKDQVVDYVLAKGSKGDRQLMANAIDDAVAILPLLFAGELEKAMHQLHTK